MFSSAERSDMERISSQVPPSIRASNGSKSGIFVSNSIWRTRRPRIVSFRVSRFEKLSPFRARRINRRCRDRRASVRRTETKGTRAPSPADTRYSATRVPVHEHSRARPRDYIGVRTVGRWDERERIVVRTRRLPTELIGCSSERARWARLSERDGKWRSSAR